MSTMPFSTFIDKKNNIQIIKKHSIVFINPALTKLFVFLQSGVRIITATKKEKKLTGNETEIIQKIHNIRYAEEHSYVTTGGHFSQLYVRNLGIFLNALLDPRVCLNTGTDSSSREDWIKRQQIALRTVALDLEVFRQAKKTYTTIVHLWKNVYSAMNIYTEPSDSLFGILYTLCALQDENFISSLFPMQPSKKMTKQPLQTNLAANTLLKDYRETLVLLINDYKRHAINPKTRLIRTDICLASARDGIKRKSSFYDNVICWSTLRLAKKLELIDISEKEFAEWKKIILAAFWDEEEGIFRDDLSQSSFTTSDADTAEKGEKRFSADSFIVTSSGFFDIQDTHDVKKLTSMITYVQKHGLDKPFPLRYSTTNQLNKLYLPVRLGAPAYMGETIWSHWGIEYIKALLLIKNANKIYSNIAKRYIAIYTQRIERYGGYPELYDTSGNIYTTAFYRGVLHNSWVINYEQAKMLLQSQSQNPPHKDTHKTFALPTIREG